MQMQSFVYLHVIQLYLLYKAFADTVHTIITAIFTRLLKPKSDKRQYSSY